MEKLRAGVIGLGIGEQHIEGYQRHPACEVATLCDISDEKRKMAQKKYPHIKVTGNADALLEDDQIHIVSIASYDNHHYEQMIRALRNGKHVFVEKPLCLYEKEARHIRSLLKLNPNLKVSSNLILRMSPRFRRLKKMIQEGTFGELFYVEGDYNYGRLEKITEGWRGKIDFYSVVYGGGVHMVDLLLWLTGDSVVEVTAYGNRIASKGSRFRYNDLVACLLKFKSGLIGKITVNMGCVHPHFHPLSVYGTKGTFVNGIKQGLVFRSSDPQKDPEKIVADYPGVHKGDMIPNFINSILNGSQAEVTEEDIFKTMSVCLAIEKATQQSGSVAVEYI